jgi:hypothetical protein
MAISTALDVIKQAMKIIGVLSPGEEPSSEEATDALDKLNGMLNVMGYNPFLTTTNVEDTHTLVASTGSYSIGSGQTIDTVKPIRIVKAFLRDAGNIDYPINLISRDVYADKSDKATFTGRPTDLFYDPGVAQQATQTGTIYLYPNPDSAYTLYIYSEKEFTEFSALTSTFTFPSSYKLMLIYNLALLLCPEYGREVSADIREYAKETKEAITRINVQNKQQIMTVDIPNKATNGTFESGY